MSLLPCVLVLAISYMFLNYKLLKKGKKNIEDRKRQKKMEREKDCNEERWGREEEEGGKLK